MRRSFWRRHRWIKWAGGGLLALLVALGAGIAMVAHRAEPFLRALIVDRLAERFHSRVELDSFHISLADGLRAEGNGLRIWPPARGKGLEGARLNGQAKPLIDLKEFHFRAPLRYAPGKPIHIWAVDLQGLTLTVPPKPHVARGAEPAERQPGLEPLPRRAALLRFRIDSVVCNGARLTLENSNPAKQPLEFDIKTIKVEHLSASRAMKFEAILTNPRPAGLITTEGSFGPWAMGDPGETPVEGVYRFEHADLSTFKGIAGILSSTGKYQGALRDMTVDGETDTPAFSLTHFGTAVPLHTTFHARVDGTNGDTWLEPVNAVLGSSHFTAAGKIVQVTEAGAPGTHRDPRHGHEIALTVEVEQGQIADFLRLTSRSGTPLLTGTLRMKTNFDLPPGTEPIHERIRMKGSFSLAAARFTDQKMQDRVGELSLRGQGKPQQAKTAAAVRSSMAGDFTMAGGAIDLPHLAFAVPGAQIELKGVYGLDGGTLAFRGVAKLQATVSQMIGGWKGLLLKPIDPLFKKDGAGTKVHVRIDGTRKDPLFGVDF